MNSSNVVGVLVCCRADFLIAHMLGASRVLSFDKGQLSPIVGTTPPRSLECAGCRERVNGRETMVPLVVYRTLGPFVPKKIRLDPVRNVGNAVLCT